MAGLNIPITATDANVMAKLDQLARKIDEVAQKTEKANQKMISDNDKLGNSFNTLMTKVGASAAALMSLQKLNELRGTITQVRGEFEQLEISLSTILGNKAEADKLMAQVVDFAAKTPFDMKGVASGVKQLLAYGSSADSVIEEMRMLGDIASGLSIPLGDIVYLFGTTRTQGRMFTQDLRQFMGRGIPLAEELAKQFGVTKAEVGDLVTAGKVGFNEMYKALQAMTSEGGKFYNLMDAQSRSILGMQSNAEDNRDQMYNKIGKLLQGVTAKGIEAQNYLYENYEKIGKTLLELVGIYGTYKAVLITTNAIMKLHNTYTRMQAIGMAMFPASYGKATTATLIFSKAQKGLLTALKATSKAMLSNPYVLAAAAVAGLAYGVYKLVTAKSAEEKAIEATNKRLQEYNDGIEKRLNNANDLISAMKDENRSSSERRESMRKLVQQYPQLLDKYGEEALMLMDIRDLKREVVGIESAKNKSNLEKEIETLKKLKTIYESRSFKGFGDAEAEMEKSLGIGRAFSFEHNLEAVNKALSETQNKLNDIYKAEADAEFASKPLAERLKIYQDRAEEARKKVKELNDEIDKLNSKPQKPGVPFAGAEGGGGVPNFIGNYVDLQAQRDAQIKAAEDAEKNAETLRKKQEEDKKVADKKSRDNAKKAEKEINKDVLKSNQERQKAELQQKIDLIQLSAKTEREKDEELHNLRLEMIQLEQSLALETLDLEYKKYKAIFEAAGKDTKPLDEAFAKLEQNTINSFKNKSDKEDADYAKKQRDRNEQAIDDMIAYNEKYGSIMERRAAIVQKYARLIEKAENESQKKTLARERDTELQEFDEKSSGVYWEMFLDASKATLPQIEKAIVLVEEKMKELLANGIQPASEEMQNLREQYEALKDAQSDVAFSFSGDSSLQGLFKSYNSKQNADAKLLDAWENGSVEDIKKAQIEAEQSTDKLKKSIAASSISIFVGGLSKAAGSMREIAEASGDIELEKLADGVDGFAGKLDSAAQGFMQGGPVGLFINLAMGAISDFIQSMTLIATSGKIARKQIDEVNKAFEVYKLEVESTDFESIFGVDKIALAADAWKKAQDALKAYNNEIKYQEDWDFWNGDKNLSKYIPDNKGSWYDPSSTFYESIAKGYSDIEALVIDTGQKGKNRYKSLKDVSEQEGWGIWGEDGEFNYENAKRFLDTYEGLTDEQRAQIENAIELKEAYEKAMEQIEQIASEIFGDLASEFADGIINAVEKGEDAFDSFGKSAGNVIKNLGKMFLESMLYEQLFDTYKDKIKEALGNKDSEKLTEITGDMLDDMQTLYPEMYAWYKNLMEKAKERGIDTDALSAQEATAKGFQAISQDTGDELNGRFTDIQAKSGVLAVGVNSLVAINTSILKDTSGLLASVREMFGIQNLQLKALNTISDNTTHLATIAQDINTLRSDIKDINSKL